MQTTNAVKNLSRRERFAVGGRNPDRLTNGMSILSVLAEAMFSAE